MHSRHIIELLRFAYESGASDLHISLHSPPVMRVDGLLLPVEGVVISSEEAWGMTDFLLGSEQRETFEEQGEVDFAYSLEDGLRFRVNVYKQSGEVSIAARLIPSHVKGLDELGLPPVVHTLTEKSQGLILVTGKAGSGKSSTLASIIDHINRHERKHIVTLEDPIEYIHAHGSSLVDQREVGSDTKSFANGLRAALRQDPDVILVGEMRDLETITAAVTAAETGHLVLSTLHTTDAPQTIDRIVDAFPGHQHAQIRAQLSAVLVAVISQRLFPKAEGKGRVCAAEVMMNTPAVANLIRSDKTHQIKSVMQTAKASGMQTMEMAVRDLVKEGQVLAASARSYMAEVSS
ncbi:type IV pilus twitching motility protein PilT [Paenibacillus sp. Marseille-Q4541]|uniref:type IV pilus twitching motility protein PilT n=1 Tax=Paenibacillus sp. Marseille-Q4541 TaxID=2831522 RepID=UPI001BAAF0CD|nr:type IV pilus twitching motility protein PilT [Paenibacillus sp. Marseille-Q4541]